MGASPTKEAAEAPPDEPITPRCHAALHRKLRRSYRRLLAGCFGVPRGMGSRAAAGQQPS